MQSDRPTGVTDPMPDRTLHVDDAVDAVTDALADLAHVITTPAGMEAIASRCLDGALGLPALAIDDTEAVGVILLAVVRERLASAIDHAAYEQMVEADGEHVGMPEVIA